MQGGAKNAKRPCFRLMPYSCIFYFFFVGVVGKIKTDTFYCVKMQQNSDDFENFLGSIMISVEEYKQFSTNEKLEVARQFQASKQQQRNISYF
jgi:hypothetical protein